MPATLDLTSPIKRHQKVVATVDLPGVPEGTLGQVRVANGFAWYRYWVNFENGVELGHVDHGHLVRADDWPRFQIERSEMHHEEAKDAGSTDHDDGGSSDGDSGPAGNSFGVPEYLLERSRQARSRLGA